MEEKNDVDKVDEIILPGFRFHPTDEELVGFYLKRKIQQRALPIELIKQLDIYKYDPWDLPNSAPPKRPIAKSLPANDSWAICRIFKKTNSMAQRALSQSWVSPILPETTGSDILTQGVYCPQLSSDTISCTTAAGSAVQFSCNNDLQQSSTSSFSPLEIPLYKPINQPVCRTSMFPISNGDLPAGFMFCPLETPGPAKCTVDFASMLFNLPPALLTDVSKASESVDFSSLQQQCNGLSIILPQEMQGNIGASVEETCPRKNSNVTPTINEWGTLRSIGFPFSLPPNLPDSWKTNSPWDSPACPSEMSVNYSTNKCYN
ncbi:hypothetical protein NE237_021501 [Protea cynaroides]|uniref:NAC domain-containing protein n=1 Tax=Protea cynaroides TaxID=273540 RepID=A0A9Q0K3C0_9MAGN|nr:hypothetical protein NE237_021501 [Protea cynaroides]